MWRMSLLASSVVSWKLPLTVAIAGLAIVGGLGLLRRTALVSVRSFPLYREESS